MRNVAALLLVFLVVKALSGSFGGYPWLVSMLRSNAELIHRYPDLTIEQKNEAKQGFPYSFMNFVKANTPPDAVILFPPRDTLLRVPELKDRPSNSSSLRNLGWASYFIYPRRMVYADDTLSPLRSRVTHVAILGKHGYEYLPLPVDLSRVPAFTVIPLKK